MNKPRRRTTGSRSRMNTSQTVKRSALVSVVLATLTPVGVVADASAKVTVSRTADSVTYRVTESSSGLGAVPLLPGTTTKVLFEDMIGLGRTGNGSSYYILPAPSDGAPLASGATALEIGEGVWTPVRRTVAVDPFACDTQSGSAATGTPADARVTKTRVTITSTYLPEAPILQAGSRSLKRALKEQFITQQQYRRLRDRRGNVTFGSVLGKARIRDTITADPFRALSFVGISNQGVKVLTFVLKPGETKSQTIDAEINCGFDTSYASDGRRGQWASLGTRASSRVYGKRPPGVPDFIWTYIRRYGDRFIDVVYARESDVQWCVPCRKKTSTTPPRRAAVQR